MSYEKLNFKTGDILQAQQLNHMEEGIYANAEAAAELEQRMDTVSGDVAALKEETASLMPLIGEHFTDVTDLSGYQRYLGFCSSAGVWSSINERYQFVVIPISGTGTLTVRASENGAEYLCGLKTFEQPISGAPLHFSEDDVWKNRLSISKGGEKSYTIPSDVNYLLVWVAYSTNGDITPQSFLYHVDGQKGRVDKIEEDINRLMPFYTVKLYRSSIHRKRRCGDMVQKPRHFSYRECGAIC